VFTVFQCILLQLYAIRIADGLLLWNRTKEARPVSPVAIDAAGDLLLGSADGNIYAVNAATGVLRWSFLVDVAGFIACPAFSTDGSIVVGSLSGMLYVLSGTGATIWSVMTTAAGIDGPAVLDAQGNIFVGARDGAVFAFDGIYRALLWRYQLNAGAVNTALAIGLGGTLIVGTDRGLLVALTGLPPTPSQSTTPSVTSSQSPTLSQTGTPSQTGTQVGTSSSTGTQTGSASAAPRANAPAAAPLSPAVIAGIAVGSVAFAAAAGLGVYWLACHSRGIKFGKLTESAPLLRP
jgi:outer membrane protein assembly factor BamB